MPKPKSRITITIDADLLDRIEAICKERGEPRSALIERVLGNEIVSEERFLAGREIPQIRGGL